MEVLILEKDHIEHCGCLGAGVNAINAYINPESFVRYVRDTWGPIREDLVLSIAERLNEVSRKWNPGDCLLKKIILAAMLSGIDEGLK